MVDFDDLRRLYEAGDESALYQAGDACRDPRAEWVAAPSWVIEALIERQIEHMRRLPGKGRGRNATLAKQHRMDLIHLARYAEFTRGLQQALNEKEAADRAKTVLRSTPFYNGENTGDAILKSVALIEEERERDPEQFRRRFTFPHPSWLLGKK